MTRKITGVKLVFTYDDNSEVGTAFDAKTGALEFSGKTDMTEDDFLMIRRSCELMMETIDTLMDFETDGVKLSSEKELH